MGIGLKIDLGVLIEYSIASCVSTGRTFVDIDFDLAETMP